MCFWLKMGQTKERCDLGRMVVGLDVQIEQHLFLLLWKNSRLHSLTQMKNPLVMLCRGERKVSKSQQKVFVCFLYPLLIMSKGLADSQVHSKQPQDLYLTFQGKHLREVLDNDSIWDKGIILYFLLYFVAFSEYVLWALVKNCYRLVGEYAYVCVGGGKSAPIYFLLWS